MATVVITHIQPSVDGGLLVVGTVDGNAWKYRRDNVQFIAIEDTGQELADEFGNNYYLVNREVNYRFASRTVKVPDIQGKQSIEFGATPMVQVGFDMLQFTATVAGVSGIVGFLRTSDFLSWAFSSSINTEDFVAKLLLRQLRRRQADLIAHIDTFTSTISTSTTSTTTTTTSTTSTTTTSTT